MSSTSKLTVDNVNLSQSLVIPLLEVTPADGVDGELVFDQDRVKFFSNGAWYHIRDTSKIDGSSPAKALQRSTDLLTAVPDAVTGWYWLIINQTPRKVWIDCDYDGGGWVLVASHPIGVSIPNNLTYAQAAESTLSYGSSTVGSGDPKTYSYWMGLDAWTAIASANNAGRNVVEYVAGSQVALGDTGSHSKRARWKWDGWNSGYSWNNANSLSRELGGNDPGLWTYHIANGYNFSTFDNDQDVNGGNCPTYYNNAPWWYGSCWSGSAWGGNGGPSYQNAWYWTGSGGDYYNYGALYVK